MAITFLSSDMKSEVFIFNTRVCPIDRIPPQNKDGIVIRQLGLNGGVKSSNLERIVIRLYDHRSGLVGNYNPGSFNSTRRVLG
jgi:hypothetical protein